MPNDIDFIGGNTKRCLFAMALPMIAAMFLNMMYNLVDSLWIGNLLGETAYAALTNSTPIILLLTSIAMGATNGISILLSQAIGAKDKARMESLIATSFIVAVIFSLLVTAGLEITLPAILSALNTPAETYDMAYGYLAIYVIGYLAVYLYLYFTAVLRSFGNSMFQAIAMLVSTILNAILDPIFIHFIGRRSFDMIDTFKAYLDKTNLSENSKFAYLFALRQFIEQYGSVTKKNLTAYKVWLVDHFKPQTVNLRLRGMNCYLESVGKEKWKLSFVKVQQKPFLENVISEADYLYFKKRLKEDGELFWYFVVRFLAATGARVSELIQIKVEHVRLGYLDLYSKGGKLRRIYIPKSLQEEALAWLAEKKQDSGFIFLNQRGQRITTRGISGELKKFAEKYCIDTKVVYPHSFRHRFAKSFLERCNDIAFLADLMGHESIETTRIYLRKTATEQREIVDSIIDW